MRYKELELDKFQELAIHAIEDNKSVVVSAPTGSGKTLIADYIIGRELGKKKRVIYTAPIKALSNQKFKEFSNDYGAENIGLLTGDVVKNPEAPILIMTTEIYRNMALINDPALSTISYVIFDEIHYINDIERGYVWEESIIFSQEHVRMLCLSATIPNAEEFAKWIREIKGHQVEVIIHNERPVPLHVAFYDHELGITTLKAIRESSDTPNYHRAMGYRKGKREKIAVPTHLELIPAIKDKLPCLYFDFSRKACQKKASELAKKNIFSLDPEISGIIRQKLREAPSEINQLDSVQLLRQILPYGIGFHHAGILPIMKEVVEDLFSKGKIRVLYATETFAVGINMPVKTVCFESLRKFDGISFRVLHTKEFFQIAGRAGRRGIDKEGFVYILINRQDFDYLKIKKITSSDVEPLRSQYKLCVNTVLNIILQHEEEEIFEILRKSFASFQKYGKVRKDETFLTYKRIRNRLERMGYIERMRLTKKGEFARKIYADTIEFGEIFATDLWKKLSVYQTFLVLACLCYEWREKNIFHKKYPNDESHRLRKILLNHPYLSREERFRDIDQMTAVIHPCYHGKSIFAIIDNTNLLEGDIIRFFRQILDRIGQVKQATEDGDLVDLLENIQGRILASIKDIDMM
ncbi:MAG: DEAD/DEAH box helicase [Nanoarchaeota archaeon]